MAAMTSKASDPADDLAEQAQPLVGPASLDVGLEKIPLPPGELVGDLDNQVDQDEAPPADVAVLDFCGSELPHKDFPLKYPFNWEGRRVDSITVAQLTTQQLGDVVRGATREGRSPELMEVYGVMCGLPAAVLRALPSTDGDPITSCAFDFLPPMLRPGGG